MWDRCLAAVHATRGEPRRDPLLMALTGLRLAVEPDARIDDPDAAPAAAAPGQPPP